MGVGGKAGWRWGRIGERREEEMVECRTRVDVSGRFVVACAMLIGPTLTPWCVTTDDDGLDDSTKNPLRTHDPSSPLPSSSKHPAISTA